MVVTMHQPEHLPWLGFFHKAVQADLFVLLDTVQYRHKYFQNRNRIRSHQGACWLTVPVLLKGRGRPLLKDVQINASDVRWRDKCWHGLTLNYRRAKFFDAHAEFFQHIYRQPWEHVVELNVALIRYLFHAFGIATTLVRASDLRASGTGPELILSIAEELGADCYLSGISGIAGRGAAPEEAFRQRGITVRYQEFHHPIYQQLYDPFVPCLSALDLCFNYGPDSLRIIQGIGVETLAQVFV